MTTIRSMRVIDMRFPTSRRLDGSDAMNPDPDYSVAYVVLGTDGPGLEGHGLTLTIGRGNAICCAAIRALEPPVVGLIFDWIADDMGRRAATLNPPGRAETEVRSRLYAAAKSAQEARALR